MYRKYVWNTPEPQGRETYGVLNLHRLVESPNTDWVEETRGKGADLCWDSSSLTRLAHGGTCARDTSPAQRPIVAALSAAGVAKIDFPLQMRAASTTGGAPQNQPRSQSDEGLLLL